MAENNRWGDMDGSPVGICHLCKHRRGPLTCVAYPAGIPTAVLTGQADHRQPQPGDGGVRFESAGASAEEVDRLLRG